MLRNPIAGIKIFYGKLKHKIKEVETFQFPFCLVVIMQCLFLLTWQKVFYAQYKWLVDCNINYAADRPVRVHGCKNGNAKQWR